MKYLGYSFCFTRGKCGLCVHKKTKDKLKRKVKSLTGRSGGMGYAQRKEILWQTFRGWMEYFKYADSIRPMVSQALAYVYMEMLEESKASL